MPIIALDQERHREARALRMGKSNALIGELTDPDANCLQAPKTIECED